MRTTVSWLVFSKKLDPPIHEHDYIKKSIDTRGIEDAPFSQNVAGDFTTFKRPPRRLNGSPPCVRIRSTVLTQPRTLVSFRGMCICLLFDFRKLRKFPMFSISGKLRNSDVSDFRKLRTPTFSEIFVLCNHSLFMSSPFTGDSVRSR